MNTTFKDIDWGAFKDKRVLIYGGLGFIGWNLTKECIRLGAKVTVVDDLSNSEISFKMPELREVELVRHSVNYQPVHDHALEADFIIWACSTQISKAHHHPVPDMMTNAAAFAYMCDTVAFNQKYRANKIQRIIYCGSVSVFGQPSTGWINGSTLPNPRSHYAISKLAGEHYARLYMHEPYNLPITVIRYSNVYGPGQTPTGGRTCGVIGKFIHEYLTSGEMEIYGEGSDIRDYTYIDDVVAFTLGSCILRSPNLGVFNFGTGVGCDIHHLIDLIDAEGDAPRQVSFEEKRQIDTVSRRIVDPQDVKWQTGWDKFVPLDQGIRWTMGWYADHLQAINDADDHE
jgi:UDP-glucose 4-epimerase